jgi:rhamnosyltransferase
LFERLQRSFDEAYAFRCLFGYRQCERLTTLTRTWYALTARDMEFVRTAGLWRPPSRIATLKMPLDNFMRLAGHYLGTHGMRLPDALRRWLSRDKRLALGLRVARQKT